MIESLIKAGQKCTKEVDIHPEKVLRPIGTVFREWNECLASTDLPHWIYWKVIGYGETFVGRHGNVLRYERHEVIEAFA